MKIDEMCADMPLPSADEYNRFFLQYRQLMMLYESAIQCIEMRLDLIGKESIAQRQRSPVRVVSSRMKTLDSITRKLKTRGLPLTLQSVETNLNDVAGVRVICEYVHDVYAIREALLTGDFIRLVEEKDYIKKPKPNGYRSLHLIVDVPVLLFEGEQQVRCEIQIRTTAMDSWAGLEHNLRYKKCRVYNAKIDQDLKDCADILFETDMRMQDIALRMGVLNNSVSNNNYTISQ